LCLGAQTGHAPGQHDAFAGDGGEDEDPGTKVAGKSAAGAYSGSLVGGMAGLATHDDRRPAQERRRSGVILSVRVANVVNEKRVIDSLRVEGAAHIEQAQGEWRDGDWRISIWLPRRDWWKARPIDSADRRNTMPLKKGSSQSVVSSNIKTLVDDWNQDGSIGTSHPLTKKKAIKQAIAIALSKAGKSRKT
jgi:hypothetical protein